jgi:hypothetical protein
VPRRGLGSAARVVLAAAVLLGLLAVLLAVVGQPSEAGTTPLTLPDPVPMSAVRYAGPPLKVLLVGDSLAGSLGVGLGELAPAYHVDLVNAGHPGCSLSADGRIQLTYFVDRPGWPCELDRPAALLAAWRGWVDAFRPDVVLYVGRTDLLNQQVAGRWTSIGHRDFNRWYAARLRAAIRVLTARGARLVLLTPPVSQEPTLNPRAADAPVRVARDGGLLRRAAATDPAVVSVYPLDQLLTPHLRYQSSDDGIPLRCADGVHLTPEAGAVVAADLYPRLWALASAHRVAGGGGWVDGPPPGSTPPWYARLSCG